MSRREFVAIRLAGQVFGIGVELVRDVLARQKPTPVPLAPASIAGLLNRRGRIATVIDFRARLGLDPAPSDQPSMTVVVEQNGELYALLVDEVGEVIALDEPVAPSPTHAPAWSVLSAGTHPRDGGLLVVLDMARALDFAAAWRAA